LAALKIRTALFGTPETCHKAAFVTRLDYMTRSVPKPRNISSSGGTLRRRCWSGVLQTLESSLPESLLSRRTRGRDSDGLGIAMEENGFTDSGSQSGDVRTKACMDPHVGAWTVHCHERLEVAPRNRTSWGPGRAWRLETPEPYLAAAARPVTRQVTQLHTSASSFWSRRSLGYGFGELMLRSQTTVRGCRGTSSEKASESVLSGERLLRLQRSSHEHAFRL